MAGLTSLSGLFQMMLDSISHKSLVRTAWIFAVWLGCITAAAGQLPPEILADQYLLQAEQQIAEKDHQAALESLQKILALQKEHGLTLPDAFHFKHAQVAFMAGSFPAALDSVNQYLVTAGRDGEFYQKALELLLAIKAAADRTPCAGKPKGAKCWLELSNQAGCYLWVSDFDPYKAWTWSGECSAGVAEGDGTLKWVWDVGDSLYVAEKHADKEEAFADESGSEVNPELRAGTPALFRDEPTCAGRAKGASCWMESSNQPGCHVWNTHLHVDATVTWTGDCVEGMAQGQGTVNWAWNGGKKMREDTGHLVDGRYHGRWKYRDADGNVWEGPYEQGKPHGKWSINWADENGDLTRSYVEGPYVNGKQLGLWTARWTDGSVEKRPIVDGEYHGQLTGRGADGNTWEISFVQHKRHGQGTWRKKDGSVEKRFFVEGQRVGRKADPGVMEEGRFVNGKRRGQWILRDADGDVEEGPYVEGNRQGIWVLRSAAGWSREGPYVEGQRDGQWVSKRSDGTIWRKGAYVTGKKHGLWVTLESDGEVGTRTTYVQGQKHGPAVETIERGAGKLWEKGSGNYEEGERHGFWHWSSPNGISISASGTYVEGKEHGVWTIRYKNGKVAEGSYVKGERRGNWIIRDGNGNVEEGSYVKGKRHGRWIEHEDDGFVAEGTYVEGKRDGTWLLYSKGKKESTLTSTLVYDNGSIAPVPIVPVMAVIPRGKFRMGSNRGYFGQEKPVHTVRVEAFELSKFEVTFEEYDRFTAATGREWAEDEGWGRGRRPVINVSWEDAVAYTQWLSSKTGNRYRLPSEAEWEYAARAGKKNKKYSWGNEIGHNRANCRGCGSQWDGEQTAPVGSFAPNAWGLHDMHGNVAEWVQDCVNWELSFGTAEGYWGAPTDGSAWESGNCSERVIRSGSWHLARVHSRTAYRQRKSSTLLSSSLGFRVARTTPP